MYYFWYTLAHLKQSLNNFNQSMLKIRLQRIGRRNEPHYRVLVAEHTTGAKSNKFVEKVGTFNPRTKETQLNTERIKYWVSVGAQPSGRVHNMLIKAGIIKGKAINVLPHKSPVIDEEKIAKEKEEAEAKEAAKKEAAEKEEADKLAAAEAAKTEAEAPKEEVVEEEKADDKKEEEKSE